MQNKFAKKYFCGAPCTVHIRTRSSNFVTIMKTRLDFAVWRKINALKCSTLAAFAVVIDSHGCAVVLIAIAKLPNFKNKVRKMV